MINVFVFSKKVIQGYEKGVPGMCKGEIRTLTVPPHLGYGERGMFVLLSFTQCGNTTQCDRMKNLLSPKTHFVKSTL